MKILILHLSDIHFENKSSYSEEHMKAIAQTVKKNKGIDTVFVIISGDIAYSGKREQYVTSFHFLSNLRNKIKENSDINRVEFVIVPGNHDVDYDLGELNRKNLEIIFRDKIQDEALITECKKMNAFYNHANGLSCFQKKNELVFVRTFKVGEYNIRINMINTGVFSSLEEDQGFHYIANKEIEKLESFENYDYVFSVMHHPHHWFNPCCKKYFERILYKDSDIIYVGHEHYSSAMQVELEDYNVEICAGGELANKGEWTNSEFHLGVLELSTRKYQMKSYRWNSKSKLYTGYNNRVCEISKNRINKFELVPNKEFLKKLYNDTKYMISDDFTDYYVFPRIEEEVFREKRIPLEIIDLETCINIIEEKKKLIFVGRTDCGKTVLLKQLFKKLVQKKVVIYLEDDYVGRDFDRTIREAFLEIYSADNDKYEMFELIDKSEKVLLLDNVEDQRQSEFEQFLQKAEEEFDTIIYTSNKFVEVDIKERLKRSATEETYVRFKVLPFFKDKRKSLVSKLVKILVEQDEKTQESIINTLCNALSKQKNIFHMDPDFIVQFTKYYCNNIGETIQNDGEIFSKVFEANIVSLIKPYAGKLSVDKIFIILDKIAYAAHTTKNYPMSQKLLFEVIDIYNKEFDSDISYIEFLNILMSAKIITKVGVDYKFYEKTYLAYFVAREIKRRCMEDGDFSEFEKALEFSCYGINADIVLFVTYITDNLNLIRKIMNKTEEYVYDWEQFSIAPITIPYLSDIRQLEVNKVSERDIRENEEQDIKNEKELDNKKSNGVDNIYDYEETELNLMKKMIRGISLLVIISRTLPSFEHLMKKDDKELCVKMIYTIPLKIFNVWAKEVEREKVELIEEIKMFGEWEYKKEKSEIADSDALNLLRWESITLLMELMNASIGNATKENTYKFLDTFDYNSSEIFRIEHLMGLEHRGIIGEFIKEVENLYQDLKEQIPLLMLRRVTRHFILTSKNIQRKQIQRLNSKLWNGQLNNAALLIAKERNKEKEQ